DDPAKPAPAHDDVLTHTCEFCGGNFTASIAGLTGRDRAITVMARKSRMEQVYTARKSFALALLRAIWPEPMVRRKQQKAQRDQSNPSPSRSPKIGRREAAEEVRLRRFYI
ncbi:MAG: hypothetical protein M3Q76_02995, partial [Acidobacteriota bacterium]|nr:hypothetical protein [Acidobacteriota bacterium]